jgi:NitT/TauT family transport system substrate-binding protein
MNRGAADYLIKRQKVGATRGSSGHFYLGLFLTHNGLKLYEIEVIDITAAELPQVLADGRVDAICTWEPNILNAKKLLWADAILITLTGRVRIFREDFYFVPNRNFAEHNPEALRRFLKTIEKGNDLIKENKDEAITIVSQRLKMERGLVASVRDDFEFQLVLDQSILITLEDEARWVVENNLTDKTEVPNYLDYVYIDALEEVKPEAVMINRF